MLSDLENLNMIAQVYIILVSSCLALTDDVSCDSSSPLGLQKMLSVCTTYSRTWRFIFNAKKSTIFQELPSEEYYIALENI